MPDRLGSVLAPWLPGTLSGSEEERISFQLDGRASELDLAGLLGGVSGRADLGLGRFVRPEIDLGGKLSLELREGHTLLHGDLQANGGKLGLESNLDLAGATGQTKPRSTLKIETHSLRANSGLAPLLALLHPAFAGLQLAQGELDGLIDLALDLSYDGPLSLAELESGWQTLPKEPFNGTGHFELRSAALKGSPVLALLRELGLDAERSLDIQPIDFTIRKGRVSYAKPWNWTLSGLETSCSGSIGLDQTLALDWSIPVSEELVKRYAFLGDLRGETLQVPLRGTLLKPRLETGDLFKSLAAQAGKKELEARLRDPQDLLDQADRLWEQGKKSEAAALYLRIREEFKLSVPYLLNKDRIKERSKYK